jgi:hypothetical protein
MGKSHVRSSRTVNPHECLGSSFDRKEINWSTGPRILQFCSHHLLARILVEVTDAQVADALANLEGRDISGSPQHIRLKTARQEQCSKEAPGIHRSHRMISRSPQDPEHILSPNLSREGSKENSIGRRVRFGSILKSCLLYHSLSTQRIALYSMRKSCSVALLDNLSQNDHLWIDIPIIAAIRCPALQDDFPSSRSCRCTIFSL